MRSITWPHALAGVILLVNSAAVSAEVRVQADGDRIEVQATQAPLSDVLDRLSKQTGMKVVYEGVQPRQLVTLSIPGRSHSEAVLGVLEGHGFNFVLKMDASGTRVDTLMILGTVAAATASRATAQPTAAQPTPPEPLPIPEDEEVEPEQPVQPPLPDGQPVQPGIVQQPGGPQVQFPGQVLPGQPSAVPGGIAPAGFAPPGATPGGTYNPFEPRNPGFTPAANPFLPAPPPAPIPSPSPQP